MNPVLLFLIVLGMVIFWFLLSFIFYPLGKFIYRIFRDAVDEINRTENKNEKDEKEIEK
jgi:hypothetical protein